MIKVLNEYKLQRGDEITVHGTDPKTGDPIYARVEYLGRNKVGGYRFQSMTYDWLWIVDKEKQTIYCSYNLDRKYPIDNSTGWLRYLPE